MVGDYIALPSITELYKSVSSDFLYIVIFTK
jgi:hypothetical protein